MITIALPILIPLVFILVFLMKPSKIVAARWSILQSVLLLIAAVVLFLQTQSKGILVLHVGGWQAPFGITLVIDYLAVLMLLVTSVISIAISVYAVKHIVDEYLGSRFYLFFSALILGVNGAFTTGDAFNLFVWFEVILISSFVLITLGNSKIQLEGGIKYMAMNLLGSMFFLAGLGLLYGKTGTLNMAHLAQLLADDNQAYLLNTSATLFIVAFGIKAAVFPLFFWLPASYHTANITVTSLFAGILTKVGVYALLRFYTLFLGFDQSFWSTFLLVAAGFTMVAGGLAAASQYETRKILSYHIISQIGYMIMGLAIATPLAIAGAIFFMLHNMIAKTNTFLVSGVISRLRGTYYLKDIGGLFKQYPLLAFLFIIPAFALAGFPPLSGFFAKFILIKAGFDARFYLITIVALATGILTLYSMVKIWYEAFLKKQPDNEFAETPTVKLSFSEVFPMAWLAFFTVSMGIFAGVVFNVCMSAAEQLTNNSVYIEAVFR